MDIFLLHGQHNGFLLSLPCLSVQNSSHRYFLHLHSEYCLYFTFIWLQSSSKWFSTVNSWRISSFLRQIRRHLSARKPIFLWWLYQWLSSQLYIRQNRKEVTISANRPVILSALALSIVSMVVCALTPSFIVFTYSYFFAGCFLFGY